MINKLRKHYMITHTVIAIILMVIGILSGRSVPSAFAAPEYTDVLDDLCIDETFDTALYPADGKNGTLEVINIAESIDGELLIYVYRPSAAVKDLSATAIRISTTVGDSYSPNDYTLRRISSNGTLEKYVVDDFTVRSDSLRYYDIICIFRAWDSDYDDPASGGNNISDTSIPVNKGYTAMTVNGVVSYACTEIETIEITDKYVGYVNYRDGVTLNWGGVTGAVTSAHFVAFDTDKPIDRLMSATVQFDEQNVSCMYCANIYHANHSFNTFYDYKYGTPTKHDPITVKASDKVFNPGGGNISVGNTYEWKRIQKTSEFLADKKNDGMKIKDDAITAFSKTEWVLNFYETQVTAKGGDDLWKGFAFGLVGTVFVDDAECKMTMVSDVTVLRLRFETDGKVYDLGVVDNKQTGSKDPVGWIDGDIPQWVWWLIGGIALIVVLIVIVAVLPNGINVVISVATVIGKGVVTVLSLPFRFVYWLVDCIAKRRDGDGK